MTLPPPVLAPVPEATVAAVQAAFPHGNRAVDLRAECGTRYDAPRLAALDSLQGCPVEVQPWRLALVVVMPFIEGLTDRQAADAVRRGMDWKEAPSREGTDAGFDFTRWHEVRCRVQTPAPLMPLVMRPPLARKIDRRDLPNTV